jgi:8-oxo-dGTP diphosphatase
MMLVLVVQGVNISSAMASYPENKNSQDDKTCPYAAVGVVIDKVGRVLISKRPAHKIKGGYWEFPGGKIEPEETPEAGLIRELKEEVGIVVSQYEKLMDLYHEGADHRARLVVFLITEFEGIAEALEEQEIRWITKEAFSEYVFLEANATIIKKIIDLLESS